ncbi:hypothetical protein ACF07T_37200 [Streptomyces sp. NPDC015184]|uniref:hypothetical protein n=1 Tax=Streptomyces sp. NPDC015184 TaxID=3364946 RepID=UPI0036F74B4C
MTAPTPAQPAPFSQHPRRWEKEQARAARIGHICDDPACEPVLIRERTRWGWADWTAPAGGDLPDRPHRIAVSTPGPTHIQRLGLRWLARRPARRIGIGDADLRAATVATALLGFLAAITATACAVPLTIGLPAATLATMLVEHLPDRLDDRIGENVLTVEDEAGCRYLQRLSALYTDILRAAAGSRRYELRRAIEIGHHQLFEVAGLLQHHDTRSVSAELIARERLMLQLAAQSSRIAASTKKTG